MRERKERNFCCQLKLCAKSNYVATMNFTKVTEHSYAVVVEVIIMEEEKVCEKIAISSGV